METQKVLIWRAFMFYESTVICSINCPIRLCRLVYSYPAPHPTPQIIPSHTLHPKSSPPTPYTPNHPTTRLLPSLFPLYLDSPFIFPHFHRPFPPHTLTIPLPYHTPSTLSPPPPFPPSLPYPLFHPCFTTLYPYIANN